MNRTSKWHKGTDLKRKPLYYSPMEHILSSLWQRSQKGWPSILECVESPGMARNLQLIMRENHISTCNTKYCLIKKVTRLALDITKQDGFSSQDSMILITKVKFCFILTIEINKSFRKGIGYSGSIMLLELNAEPININLIQVYAPTWENVGVKQEFHEFIQDVVMSLEKQYITMVREDFYAMVGTSFFVVKETLWSSTQTSNSSGYTWKMLGDLYFFLINRRFKKRGTHVKHTR